MAKQTLVLHGYREFMKANARAVPESRNATRKTFAKVGGIVQREASGRMAPIDAGSAAGFKVRVRQRGIAVEQSRRRTTGKRGDYGALQMRKALLPALMSKEDELIRELERALDEVCDHYERRP